ncbi:TetR/AcrR family transcriptional regulator [Nioella sediminis]|jgi:AcrR family transcriptional regulator|uniref:TetR/AcrR family transcriptional regulator n=1 Tax=Nioella sediminis TaxID=1912092 RepID=UPI0008FD12DB|nr:TetR/AcrR family transcriptional regulator [Nioella sediminis]
MTRHSQRERTRKAILDGARQLLAEGAPVTVAAAAERHGVSKATAYRYFSDPDILVSEAMLDIEVKSYEEITRGTASLRDRLLAINLYFLDLALENEMGFRQFLGRTLTVSASGTGDVRRGARRISMYRQALADDDGGLTRQDQDALVRALAPATGIEAMTALLDVAGAGPEQAREAVSIMTLAILDRFLGSVARDAIG